MYVTQVYLSKNDYIKIIISWVLMWWLIFFILCRLKREKRREEIFQIMKYSQLLENEPPYGLRSEKQDTGNMCRFEQLISHGEFRWQVLYTHAYISGYVGHASTLWLCRGILTGQGVCYPCLRTRHTNIHCNGAC